MDLNRFSGNDTYVPPLRPYDALMYFVAGCSCAIVESSRKKWVAQTQKHPFS